MQLNVMPLSELLTTANNYATSIKELGIYSDLVKELCNRLDAGSLAMREKTKQCDALAAEVQAVRWACGQVYVKGYNHGHLNTADGLDYASETELVERGGETLDEFTDPDHCGVAADAILREVRAQGIEMFAERKYIEMMSLHPDTHAVGSIAAEMSSQVKQLREFAAQLRQGGAA
ncbi:hypothetical protein R2215_003639 [Cronobacter turicensis]|nr:hypothetical protein [Cronobacter turicensis]ELQ6130867.1 hypothetical protein [Cronobacter turicensis]